MKTENNNNKDQQQQQYKTTQLAALADLEIFLNDKTKRINPVALSPAADGSGAYILLYSERIKKQ